MKTYNLAAGQLYAKHGNLDCFCALGVYGAEKGIPLQALRDEKYSEFNQFAEDLEKMAEVLAPLAYDYAPTDPHADPVIWVYGANDKRDFSQRKTGEPVTPETAPYKVSAEQIKEALALVGINVELNDVRGRERELWTTESSST